VLGSSLSGKAGAGAVVGARNPISTGGQSLEGAPLLVSAAVPSRSLSAFVLGAVLPFLPWSVLCYRAQNCTNAAIPDILMGPPGTPDLRGAIDNLRKIFCRHLWRASQRQCTGLPKLPKRVIRICRTEGGVADSFACRWNMAPMATPGGRANVRVAITSKMSTMRPNRASGSSKTGPEPLVALQAEYHPYLDQSKLLAAARQRELVFIAYCPLARGRLFSDPVLAEIAEARGRSIAQVALRWLLQQNVAAIPRSSNPQRIADNFKMFDFMLTTTR
jgi:hypothetical protein